MLRRKLQALQNCKQRLQTVNLEAGELTPGPTQVLDLLSQPNKQTSRKHHGKDTRVVHPVRTWLDSYVSFLYESNNYLTLLLWS